MTPDIQILDLVVEITRSTKIANKNAEIDTVTPLLSHGVPGGLTDRGISTL